jgi:hypothetical protein
MSEPQIILGGIEGFHNTEGKTKPYRDLSTVCVIPTRGQIPARVVETWMALQAPMNQKFCRMFVTGMEVGDAYEEAIEQILGHPDLKDWKYVLTLEEDNTPPPDGLLKLYDHFEDRPLSKGSTGRGRWPLLDQGRRGAADVLRTPRPPDLPAVPPRHARAPLLQRPRDGLHALSPRCPEGARATALQDPPAVGPADGSEGDDPGSLRLRQDPRRGLPGRL